MKKVSVNDCSIVELKNVSTEYDSLVIQNSEKVSFEVKRVFYIYDIPKGKDRGAHAHKECHQFIVSVKGSFEVKLDDGVDTRTIRLDKPHYGIHIPPGIWAEEKDFSSGAICLVLASEKYDEDDYIRKYKDFIKYREI